MAYLIETGGVVPLEVTRLFVRRQLRRVELCVVLRGGRVLMWPAMLGPRTANIIGSRALKSCNRRLANVGAAFTRVLNS
jgi:hypothetical protein